MTSNVELVQTDAPKVEDSAPAPTSWPSLQRCDAVCPALDQYRGVSTAPQSWKTKNSPVKRRM